MMFLVNIYALHAVYWEYLEWKWKHIFEISETRAKTNTVAIQLAIREEEGLHVSVERAPRGSLRASIA